MRIKLNFKKLTALAISAIISTLLVMKLCAEENHSKFFFKDTKIVSGLFVRVMNAMGSVQTAPDQWLCYGVNTTNVIAPTAITVYLPKESEYAYQIELLNSNGVAMPKTNLGKRAGTKFLNLDTSFSSKKAKLRITGAEGKQVLAGIYLFRPNDLFEIKDAGNYTLQIHFQIIVRTGDETNRIAHIIRFPVLDYLLIKPDSVSKE